LFRQSCRNLPSVKVDNKRGWSIAALRRRESTGDREKADSG